MNLHSLGFLFREAFLNVRRNGLMSLAALGTVTVALTVLGASLWTTYRLTEYAQQLPQKFNQVDVFLANGADRAKADALSARIQTIPEVRLVRLIPKEQAWSEMEKEQPQLTQAMPTNPLPDKLEVEVKDPAQLSNLAAFLRDASQYPEVAKVIDASGEVRKMLGFARVIRVIGGGTAVGLFIATLFIVQNTIRLTVFARRREIRIMQLVGATPGFIRLPLLLEGIFHGLCGAGIAGAVVLFCGREVSRFVSSLRSPLVEDVPAHLTSLQVVLWLVTIGGFVGLVGSHLSMRRFLKQI